jgi:hypothetical protein
MIWIARIVVTASALWLLCLAVALVVTPGRASRFLGLFASSARAHYLEQSLRLVAGAGFIFLASEMRFSSLFSVFGWVVTVTSVALLLMPWQWHRRFAQWAVPQAVRHIWLFAAGSFVLGALILFAVISPVT